MTQKAADRPHRDIFSVQKVTGQFSEMRTPASFLHKNTLEKGIKTVYIRFLCKKQTVPNGAFPRFSPENNTMTLGKHQRNFPKPSE